MHKNEEKHGHKKNSSSLIKSFADLFINAITDLFKGRLSRKGYLKRYLFASCLLFLGLFATSEVFHRHPMIVYFYFGILSLQFIFYLTTLDYRRLQDLGYSGWFAIFIRAAFYFSITLVENFSVNPNTADNVAILLCMNLIFTLALLLVPGQKKKNKYGDPAKQTHIALK